MTTLHERYQKGIETRTMFGGGTLSPGSVPWDLAPDLNRIAGEALFGSIWHRPALATMTREMITLTCLCAVQRENQLHRHINNALNQGMAAPTIVEVFIHASWYGGIPTALNAIGIAKEVFAERGIDFTPNEVFDPSESPDDLYERGTKVRQEYMGAPGGGPGPVTQAEREFNRLSAEYYWGSTWSRPGLELKDRCMITMAALTVLGREGPLRSHIRAALNIGMSQEDIVEVFIHTCFYGGLPFTRAAIDLANEIFRG